jgi:hypothetical protein
MLFIYRLGEYLVFYSINQRKPNGFPLLFLRITTMLQNFDIVSLLYFFIMN